jgi:hypothetical protein
MRCVSGRAGTATSPWCCWRTRLWPSPAPRPPAPSGHRGTRQPERRPRAAAADRARGPPAAGGAGVGHPGQARLRAGLVQVASTPSGPCQARTLPPSRKASGAGVPVRLRLRPPRSETIVIGTPQRTIGHQDEFTQDPRSVRRPPPSAAPRSDRPPDRLAIPKVAGQTTCLLMWSGRLTLPRPPRTRH